MEKILITGSAGFIGFHLTKKLLKKNYQIVGIDNLNSYYDIKLKKNRNKELLKSAKIKKNFFFFKIDICDRIAISNLFKKHRFKKVFHLAAQAGVRHSFEYPYKYIDTNISGFFNILENCKIYNVKKLVFASSSSVYGEEKKTPFAEAGSKTLPIQLYAATKLSNEIIASTYSKLFNIKIIGLRFFTVYGPWGRPDMSLYSFLNSIVKKKKIELYNNGNHFRDFTYIDDVIAGIIKAANYNSKIFEIFNIGYGRPTKILTFVKILSKILKTKINLQLIKKQRGDMDRTYCDGTKAFRILKFKPKVTVEEGIERFVKWYIDYYNLKI